ncbi:GGDEF domain-containing protein [Cognatishimia activa]|uniref:GGDEF domain-containing protein n=1 Tax=Cognatishimia activa TaxID=1715691 RepID=UPI00222E2BE2|nr:GGDEF domain-containing protein [Cognatishimia activa]UZD91555.1 GGDEF domain-containing protein [Cognatishimia activa]
MNIQTPTLRFANTMDILCPMHVHIGNNGRIVHAGPTIKKLRPKLGIAGGCFLEVFDLLRPRRLKTVEDVLHSVGDKVHIGFKDVPTTTLQGVVVSDPFGNGVLMNLSFGISVLDAVQDYALTNADFAATDMAIEMLFLVEAKSAAMDASQKLNKRLQNAKIAAEKQAFTDDLTGLRNRRAIEQILDQNISERAAFSFLQLDLDFFKAVNDTYGHAAGDYVLQKVARVLSEEARDQDEVARIGGDEFVIVVQGDTPRARLADLSQRIIRRLKQPIHFEGNPCRVSTSIGISSVKIGQVTSADLIMQQADKALYKSKENGRSQFAFFEDFIEKSGSP